MSAPSIGSEFRAERVVSPACRGASVSAGALSRRAVIIGLIAFALLEGAMRVPYAQRSLIVVDEFQHLHAAYAVAHGQTAYVDFFEHHTPLFYYLLPAVLPMQDANFDTIIAARYVALAFSALALAIAWWFVRRLYGETEAVVAAVLLAANFLLFARGGLNYVDPHATPFVILSAALLAGSRGKPWRCAASAFALGIAVLFTQKSVFAGFAPLIWFACRLRDDAPRSRWWKDLAAYALGGAAAAMMIPLLIGIGAMDDFWHTNVTMNLGWKVKRFPLRELAVLAATDGFIYLLAAVGSVAMLREWVRRRFRVRDEDLPALYLAALTAGIFLMPVVWEEYFIQLVPFAVIVGAVTLVRLAERCRTPDGRFRPFGAGTSRVASLVLALAAGMMVADLLGRIVAGEDPMSGYAVAGTIGLWLAVGLYIASGRAATSLAPWFALVLVFPIVQQADWIDHNSNQRQRERIEYVLHETRPTDHVFDGFSGWSVFRPHAYYYYFLHDEVQAMLSAEEQSTDIIRALERHQPPLVIADRWVRMLPAAVMAYIDAHYEDTPFQDIKRRRAKPPGGAPS